MAALIVLEGESGDKRRKAIIIFVPTHLSNHGTTAAYMGVCVPFVLDEVHHEKKCIRGRDAVMLIEAAAA